MKFNIIFMIWISVVFTFPQISAFAQFSDETTKYYSVKSIAKNVGGDIMHVFSSPLRMNSNDELKLLTLTAVAAGFFSILDKPINEKFISEGAKVHNNDDYLFLGKELAQFGYSYDRINDLYFFIYG